MPMSRIGWIVILLLFPLSLMAQRARPHNLGVFDYQQFHFGYSVGINRMGFTLVPTDSTYSIGLKQYPGININLITNFRLAKYLDLRINPGIQFSQRDLTVWRLSHVQDSTGAVTVEASEQWGPKKVESVFLDFPILLKYRAERVNNFAPYILAGINPRIDLTGGEIQNWKPVKRLVRAFDVYPELGIGFDFYTPRVKVVTELKFAIGLLNVYKHPGEDAEYRLYAEGVSRIFSRMIVLSVHIE